MIKHSGQSKVDAGNDMYIITGPAGLPNLLLPASQAVVALYRYVASKTSRMTRLIHIRLYNYSHFVGRSLFE